MSDFEQAVFISYAWGEEREEIVNQIDQTLQQRGLKIIRDKRDLGYKGSISEFMERIGRGNCVIVVVSDKYLRSPNCMFELVEIADGTQFHDRIFPVVLNDADIYDPVKRAEYVKYWEIKRKELAKAMKKLDPANLQGIREDMDLYDRIRDRISELTSILKDMNTLTLDIHRDSDFSDLYDAIEKRLGESSPPPVIKTLELQPLEPETIEIPAGPFKMGCNASEGIPKYETPEHEVDIPAFRMGCLLVTNLQYEEFVRTKGKVIPQIMRWRGQLIPPGLENAPVLGVTWEDAMQYCEWLSQKTGRKYSLPNEAQWEKARRGSYPCSEDMGKVLEWTCSLWGERRNEPDARYCYPWKNEDGRNNPNANRQIRRVLRGFTSIDETGIRRSCARYGRAVDDPGFGEVRYGFRVILNF